ncbi:MAG: calcium/sodium antiporter [Planctomycetia bacterium]|nr:MAG: calcium/sodium antiporter [Planctomycetia bacterium]
MVITIALLIVGLACLIGGADVLIRGVSAIAHAMGVPPLVIGMTVVAFGTSTPELVLNTVAAANGETGLAFGNIIGACAINIGFVLAVTALIKPLKVQTVLIVRELPMMLLATAAIVVMAEDRLSGGDVDKLMRADGIMLLLLFGVFLYYTIFASLHGRKDDAFITEVEEQTGKHRRRPILDVAFIVIGLAAVGGGARLVLTNAVALATAAGVPEAVIGFTLLSFGTTLPELTTSILAARRGQPDIALGNVVGSNIFNLLFIGGIVAVIHPIEIPPGGQLDVALLAVLSALLLPITMGRTQVVSRGEGLLLLVLNLSYVAYRAWSA